MLKRPSRYVAHLLLSPEGKAWELKGYEIRQHLRFFGSDAELAGYCVTNLGFTLVSQGADYARVRTRPGWFGRGGFEALVTILVRQNPARVSVEFDLDPEMAALTAAAEIFSNLNDVVAYLDAIRGLSLDEIKRPDFFSEQLQIGRLSGQSRAKLRQALARWRRNKGVIGTGKLTQLLNAPFDADMLLTRRDGKSERVVPETWPSYITIIDADTLPLVPGRSFEDIPYRGDYIVEAAAGFSDVLRTGEPALDLVEASLPQADGSTRRVRYERLCLPWRGPGGEIFVSSVSAFRSKRNVPFPPRRA